MGKGLLSAFFCYFLVHFLSSAGLATVQSVQEDLKLLEDLVTDSKRALGPHSEEPQLKGCTISKILDFYPETQGFGELLNSSSRQVSPTKTLQKFISALRFILIIPFCPHFSVLPSVQSVAVYLSLFLPLLSPASVAGQPVPSPSLYK